MASSTIDSDLEGSILVPACEWRRSRSGPERLAAATLSQAIADLSLPPWHAEYASAWAWIFAADSGGYSADLVCGAVGVDLEALRHRVLTRRPAPSIPPARVAREYCPPPLPPVTGPLSEFGQGLVRVHALYSRERVSILGRSRVSHVGPPGFLERLRREHGVKTHTIGTRRQVLRASQFLPLWRKLGQV